MEVLYLSDSSFLCEHFKRKVKDFSVFYASMKNISLMLCSAVNGGELTSPSPYSDNNGVCVGSYTWKFNFLKFRDGDKFFYIFQNRFYCSGLWLPEENVLIFFAENKIKKEVVDLLGDVQLSLGGCLEPVVFEGVINAKGRPYHYLYSKAPAVFAYAKNVPGLNIVDVEDATFIPGSFFSSRISSARVFSSYIDMAGCAVFPGWPLGTDKFQISKWQKELNEFLVHKVKMDSHLGSVCNQERIKIWIGVSAEKRKSKGLEEFVFFFIKKCAEKYPGVLIFFDGLTRPCYLNKEKFLRRKSYDNDAFERINDKLLAEGIDCHSLSLVGMTALEKIKIASVTDFFFSYALTDSMWCSVFGEVPGVCWYGKDLKKVRSEHLHNYTYFIPKGGGYSLEEGGEYSRESFVFFPQPMSEALFQAFEISLENEKHDFLSISSVLDIK